MPLTPDVLPIVFSDLDGTLLDHDTYDWAPARPALDALVRRRIPLVLVTSKTRAEVEPLRSALGNTHPYIVENGAATFVPPGYFDADDSGPPEADGPVAAGPDRDVLGEILAAARGQPGYRFSSFRDLGPEGIARVTGLSLAAASAANDRTASEPLLWQDDPQRLARFSDWLGRRGLRCVRGGRFVHVLGDFDKADAVGRLAGRYARLHAPRPTVVIALGDGPNDLAMLAKADIAVVIRAGHRQPMPLPDAGRVIRTSKPGPDGWRDAVLDLLGEPMPDS